MWRVRSSTSSIPCWHTSLRPQRSWNYSNTHKPLLSYQVPACFSVDRVHVWVKALIRGTAPQQTKLSRRLRPVISCLELAHVGLYHLLTTNHLWGCIVLKSVLIWLWLPIKQDQMVPCLSCVCNSFALHLIDYRDRFRFYVTFASWYYFPRSGGSLWQVLLPMETQIA